MLFLRAGPSTCSIGRNATEKLFYSYTSISKPAAIYCYDTRREEAVAWRKRILHSILLRSQSRKLHTPPTDGTSVPLFLAARKDLLHSGPLPTFLTGYGGFGSCVTPRFTAFATFLMEQGFLFAVPALRGGSELGEQWHRAGKRENRQNSFDDFVAAAEWLIRRTAVRYPAVSLLAVARTPAYSLALPLLNAPTCSALPSALARCSTWRDITSSILRRDGQTNMGRQKIKRTFNPSWPIRPTTTSRTDVAYPAVLLISGDADTRCNPMHARKMAARLQAATSSTRPVLLDYKTAWGHTPVQPHSTKIEALTDRLAFICHELGVHVQPGRSL